MSKLTPLFQTSTKSTRTYTRHSPDCCETIVSQHNRVSRVKTPARRSSYYFIYRLSPWTRSTAANRCCANVQLR